MEKERTYIDTYGDIYTVAGELGRGGQGVVYRAVDGDCAIKVRINSNGEEVLEVLDQQFQKKIKNILRLPIRDINEIALPAQMLKEYSGYIMPLLSNMKEIKSLLNIEVSDNVPKWLSHIKSKDTIALLSHYSNTGSLKRRVELLIKISAVLMQLHNRGLVYGDISLNNIFYSVEDGNVYISFIDVDNIIFNEKVRSAIFTPKYGAPELISGKGMNSIMSDCFSFAVIAFHILSFSHPFEGEKLENDEEDWADSNYDSIENQFDDLYSNPWIYSEEDKSNHAVNGLPVDLILDNGLYHLFDKMFTKGVKNIIARPVVAEFYYALIKAYNKIITCNHCGMTFYYSEGENKCPYCEEENNEIIIIKAIQQKTGKIINCFYETYRIGEPIRIPYSAFIDYDIKNIYDDAVIIQVEKNYLEIQFINNNNGKKRMNNFFYKFENKSKTILFDISITR